MLEKFKSPKARKQLLVACGVAVMAAFLLNLYVNRSLKPECERPRVEQTVSSPGAPTPNPTATSPCTKFEQIVIDIVPSLTIEFLGAAMTAVFFLCIIILYRDEEEAADDIKILFQPDQTKSHRDALSKTSFWYHDGHLASWVTKQVLPEFQRRFQQDMCRCKVKVAIMDPRNNEVCQTYLEHVSGLPEDENWYRDLDSVKAQLCASIYLLVKGYQPNHLNVEIYLKDRIDFIRDDIASTRAFWTTVGKSVPAIVLTNRQDKFIYYNLMMKNFDANINLYAKQKVAEAHAALQRASAHDRREAVKAVLQFLFPEHPLLYSDDSLGRIDKCLGR